MARLTHMDRTDLLSDAKSGRYTLRQLVDKYDVTANTVMTTLRKNNVSLVAAHRGDYTGITMETVGVPEGYEIVLRRSAREIEPGSICK